MVKNIRYLIVVVLLLAMGSLYCQATKEPKFRKSPVKGYMPYEYVTETPKMNDAALASAVAEIIFSSLYGSDATSAQKPFVVSSPGGDAWKIGGRIDDGKEFCMFIQKSDCRVLHVSGYTSSEYLGELSMKHISTGLRRHDFWQKFMDFCGYPMSCIPFVESLEREDEKNADSLSLLYDMSDGGYVPDASVYDLDCGIVRNATTAYQIGSCILSSFYGGKRVRRAYSHSVKLLDGDVWQIVYKGRGFEHDMIVWLQKADCRLIACGEA